jgi:hypothetical protein
MGTWSTCTTINGEPARVLDVLTDPEACRRWSPVDFDLAGRAARLQAGTEARVAGRIAGREVGFDVRILQADERRLALRASGPIDIEARYDAVAVHDDRTRLCAEVSVRPSGGFVSRVLSGATDALLAAGALEQALGRIARETAAGEQMALAA